MTKEENNRIIAEFVGCAQERCSGDLCWHGPHGEHFGRELPDFYLDEEANALVLEKFATIQQFCCVEVKYDGWCEVWGVLLREKSLDEQDEHAPIFPEITDEDRKTAIVEAALKFIEAEKGKS